MFTEAKLLTGPSRKLCQGENNVCYVILILQVFESRSIFNSANIILRKLFDQQGQDWLWTVNLLSFESVHGISRVVKLLPDKLATAIAINKENLPDPKDDGTFMIVLVIDLLKFYQELDLGQSLRTTDGASNVDVQPLPENELEVINETVQSLTTNEELRNLKTLSIENLKSSFNFQQILEKLSNQLKSFKGILSARLEPEFENFSLSILSFCEDILAACHIYMDFVHPVILEIKRRGRIEEELVEQLKSNLTRKLNENNRKLTNEFVELSKTYVD